MASTQYESDDQNTEYLIGTHTDEGVAMTGKWWEKTVEYRFVLTAAEHGSMFAAPLDGEEEKAGDTIFSLAAKWLLIEFKRDGSCLAREKTKFDDYEKARAELKARDRHHFLVYGSPAVPESKEPFQLTYMTFFSGQLSGSFSEVVASGTSENSFRQYLFDFLEFKKTTKSSSGGRALPANAVRHLMVAGVTNDNRLVTCVSFDEFFLSINKTRPHQPQPEPQRTRDPERSGPGR